MGFGASKTHANVIAHKIRLDAGPDLSGKDPYAWNCPPEDPCGRRNEATCFKMTALQQACPPVLNGGTEMRHFGKATQGFAGHRSMRLARPSAELSTTLDPGRRNKLSTTMLPDRDDCQPYEMHRTCMPGYAGH